MASPLRQFLVAVYLAAGFVLVRLLYGIIFGAGGSGKALFTIPEIELSGIFSHVTIFGTVTLEMLKGNLLLALPFAFVILIFGALGLLIRPAKLLQVAKKSKVGSQLLAALAIALMQIPSLASSWQRISKARLLRQEKRLRMLVSLFEVSISKALAIGLRLHLDSPRAKARSLKLQQFSPAGASHGPVDLEITPGDLVVITGATGIGKTGLLEALSGLTADYFGRKFDGQIPEEPDVQFLPQSPRELLFGPTVRSELLGCEPRFGLSEKLDLSVANLSEGEAVQVLLSRIFSSESDFYLLDEPFSSLDQFAGAELLGLIQKAISSGKAVVIVEHQTSVLEALHPKFLKLTAEGLEDGIWGTTGNQHQLTPYSSNAPALLFNIPVVKAGKQVLLQEVSIEIRAGEAIAVTGANGSGKTSLLKALLESQPGKDVVMVPELVEDFFVCQTLFEELERADKIGGVATGFTKITLESFIDLNERLLDTHPRDLSAGQKLALACAMQISHKPKVLLIDEPVKGFDPELRSRVVEVLGCVLETSTAIIFATHDREFATGLAAREFEIQDGVLTELEISK